MRERQPEGAAGDANGGRVDHSGEWHRKGIAGDGAAKRAGKPLRGKANLEVHAVRFGTLDPVALPADARRKHHASVTIRDIRIVPWNIRFGPQAYFSPGERRRYIPLRPAGVEQGEFGPEPVSTVVTLKDDARAGESGIARLLEGLGAGI